MAASGLRCNQVLHRAPPQDLNVPVIARARRLRCTHKRTHTRAALGGPSPGHSHARSSCNELCSEPLQHPTVSALPEVQQS